MTTPTPSISLSSTSAHAEGLDANISDANVDEPDDGQMAGKFYRFKYEILRSLQESLDPGGQISLPLSQGLPSKRLPLPSRLVEDHFRHTDDGQPKTKTTDDFGSKMTPSLLPESSTFKNFLLCTELIYPKDTKAMPCL